MVLIKVEEAVDNLLNGDGRLFDAWLKQQEKLNRFPLYRVADYLLLAIKNTIQNIRSDGLYTFPNFCSVHNALRTLRWALMRLIEGGDC